MSHFVKFASKEGLNAAVRATQYALYLDKVGGLKSTLLGISWEDFEKHCVYVPIGTSYHLGTPYPFSGFDRDSRTYASTLYENIYIKYRHVPGKLMRVLLGGAKVSNVLAREAMAVQLRANVAALDGTGGAANNLDQALLGHAVSKFVSTPDHFAWAPAGENMGQSPELKMAFAAITPETAKGVHDTLKGGSLPSGSTGPLPKVSHGPLPTRTDGADAYFQGEPTGSQLAAVGPPKHPNWSKTKTGMGRVFRVGKSVVLSGGSAIADGAVAVHQELLRNEMDKIDPRVWPEVQLLVGNPKDWQLVCVHRRTPLLLRRLKGSATTTRSRGKGKIVRDKRVQGWPKYDGALPERHIGGERVVDPVITEKGLHTGWYEQEERGQADFNVYVSPFSRLFVGNTTTSLITAATCKGASAAYRQRYIQFPFPDSIAKRILAWGELVPGFDHAYCFIWPNRRRFDLNKSGAPVSFPRAKLNDKWDRQEMDKASYQERLFNRWTVNQEPIREYTRDKVKYQRYKRLIGKEGLPPLNFPDQKFHIAVDDHVYLGKD